jgi:hypothetical protein
MKNPNHDDNTFSDDASRADRSRAPRERPQRIFETGQPSGPYGASSVSLLLGLLVERAQANAWSVQRQRAHARALLELAPDHYFTDEESSMLRAFSQ